MKQFQDLGEVVRYAITNDSYISEVTELSGLGPNHAILFTLQEFGNKFDGMMECLGKGTGKSLTNHGVTGYCIVGYVENHNINPLFSHYIVVDTFRPDVENGQLVLNRDPTLIPIDKDGRTQKYGYRLYHGANVHGWPTKTISYSIMNPISVLPVNQCIENGCLSCTVPELSSSFIDPINAFESQYSSLNFPS